MDDVHRERDAWTELVREGFYGRNRGLCFAEPRLADPTRAAIAAGMIDEIALLRSWLAGRAGTLARCISAWQHLREPERQRQADRVNHSGAMGR